MNRNFLNRMFHLLNPLLFLRGASIYAGIIANFITTEQLPENAAIILRGSGVVPRKLRKKVGEPKILIKEGISRALTKKGIKKAIQFGIASKSQGEFKEGNYQVRCEKDAIIIEPVKNEQARDNVFVNRDARNDLRRYYQGETERLIELHRQGTPAFFSQTGDSLSVLRKKLVENCIAEAVRIAQDEIKKQHGVFSNQFAFILCAGAVRGLSLFSDVDYIFVSAAEDETNRENKSYFELLVRRIQEILTEIGLKADNLIERFSKGKMTLISVCDLQADFRKIKEFDSITHALLDQKPLEQVGNEEVYKRFCVPVEPCLYGKNALNLKRWRRLYLRQYLRKKSIKREAMPNPSVWLREITIFYMLAKHDLRLSDLVGQKIEGETSAPGEQELSKEALSFYKVFEELALRNLITAREKQKFFDAYEFFMKARNEVGLVYQGVERPIEKKKISPLSSHLFYPSEADFLAAYSESSQFIEAMLDGFKQKVGHKKWKLDIINLWGAVIIKMRPFVNYFLNGDAQVSITPAANQ